MGMKWRHGGGGGLKINYIVRHYIINIRRMRTNHQEQMLPCYTEFEVNAGNQTIYLTHF